jgi:hypothetical protein
MRKRVIGAGAVILVALGIWLGNMFKGLGPGGDSTTDSTDSDGENVRVALTSDGEPATTDNHAQPANEAPDVLTLLVDDDKYLIQIGEDWYAEFAPATLDEIVTRLDKIPGDENGVRVRLRFKANAQNGAISDLKSALTDAGVDPEAIIEDPDYVE